MLSFDDEDTSYQTVSKGFFLTNQKKIRNIYAKTSQACTVYTILLCTALSRTVYIRSG